MKKPTWMASTEVDLREKTELVAKCDRFSRLKHSTVVFDAIRALMEPPKMPRRRIG